MLVFVQASMCMTQSYKTSLVIHKLHYVPLASSLQNFEKLQIHA